MLQFKAKDIFHSLKEIFLIAFLLIKWLIKNFKSGNSDSLACLSGKTAIVTGGNAGIGFATSLLLASRGCKVIIACRSDASKARDEIIERTGNSNIEFRKLDLSSLKSVRDFAQNIINSESKIDILINNAGVGVLPQKFTEDGLIAVMQTNYFGPFLLTHLLLEPMKAAERARVVFTGSVMAIVFQNLKVDDLVTYCAGDPVSLGKLYSNTKFCNILAAQEFGKKLRKFGITVNATDTGVAGTPILEQILKPGWHFSTVTSYLALRILARDPINAAQTAFHLASSEKLREETGQLYFRCERFPKYGLLNDQDFCYMIWKKTAELVMLKPEEKI